MCKVVIARTEKISHTDWLNLRLKGIGGSEAAAVCGMSRYDSPLEVWLLKTGRKAHESDNEAMYFWRLLEPVIREEFARRTGLEVKHCPFMFRYKEYPFMLANIDGVITERDGTKALLEIKTTNSLTTGKDLEEGLPVEWYCQIQHYMAVTELKKAYVAVLIGGNKFISQEVTRDEETIRTLIALETHFWNEYVLKDTAPPVDEKSTEALNLLYPQSREKLIELTQESDFLIAQYKEIKTAEDEIKKAKADVENHLKAMLGENESGITPNGFKVSWKSYVTKRLDSAKLKAKYPEIVEKYTTQVNSRKFSITDPKSKK